MCTYIVRATETKKKQHPPSHTPARNQIPDFVTVALKLRVIKVRCPHKFTSLVCSYEHANQLLHKLYTFCNVIQVDGCRKSTHRRVVRPPRLALYIVACRRSGDYFNCVRVCILFEQTTHSAVLIFDIVLACAFFPRYCCLSRCRISDLICHPICPCPPTVGATHIN